MPKKLLSCHIVSVQLPAELDDLGASCLITPCLGFHAHKMGIMTVPSLWAIMQFKWANLCKVLRTEPGRELVPYMDELLLLLGCTWNALFSLIQIHRLLKSQISYLPLVCQHTQPPAQIFTEGLPCPALQENQDESDPALLLRPQLTGKWTDIPTKIITVIWQESWVGITH